MGEASRLPRRPAAALVLSLVAICGCASSNDGGLLAPTPENLEGTWEYRLVNAYEAVFTGCTHDAAVLEGMDFAHGMSVAPICVASNTFEVVEQGDGLTVLPHQVNCSDGSSASVTAVGFVVDDALTGEWQTTSDGGVDSLQRFSGSMGGAGLEISESTRTFAGNFQGSCNLLPPLQATVRIF